MGGKLNERRNKGEIRERNLRGSRCKERSSLGRSRADEAKGGKKWSGRRRSKTGMTRAGKKRSLRPRVRIRKGDS